MSLVDVRDGKLPILPIVRGHPLDACPKNVDPSGGWSCIHVSTETSRELFWKQVGDVCLVALESWLSDYDGSLDWPSRRNDN